MRRRLLVVGTAVVLLVGVVVGLGSQLRREFFPEVDAGAFEVYVRAEPGTKIEETERRVAEVEKPFEPWELHLELEPGTYLVRVESKFTQHTHEHFAAVDLVAK